MKKDMEKPIIGEGEQGTPGEITHGEGMLSDQGAEGFGEDSTSKRREKRLKSIRESASMHGMSDEELEELEEMLRTFKTDEKFGYTPTTTTGHIYDYSCSFMSHETKVDVLLEKTVDSGSDHDISYKVDLRIDDQPASKELQEKYGSVVSQVYELLNLGGSR